MNMAFEITFEDVQHVADRHGVELSDSDAGEVIDRLDIDEIVNGLLNYTNMEDQTNSAYDDIENALLEQGVIEGDKWFHSA